MFANHKFSQKNAPKFRDAFVGDPEKDRDDYKNGSTPYLKARISNDYDIPPKVLVAIDFYDIPEDATGALKGVYDFIHGVSLMPEDAIKLVNWLNKLLSAIFDEHNYIRR